MASLSDNTDHIANDLAKGGDEAVEGGMLLPLQLPFMFLSLSLVLLESPSSLIDRLLEPNEDDPVSSDLRSGTLCLTSHGCCPAGEGEGVGELGSAEKVTRGSLML